MVGFLIAAALTAVTSSPSNNFFVAGRPVDVMLEATGLAAGAQVPLALDVYDFTFTNRIARVDCGLVRGDGKGSWRGVFRLPSDRYGVFLVRPRGAGLDLVRRGSMPKGAFTYAVVDDPAAARDIDPWDAFLGLHGVPATDIRPWLRARGGLGDARRPSDASFVVANLERFNNAPGFWKNFRTDPAVREKYRRDIADYVRAAVAAGAGRQGRRFYETTWEANLKSPDAQTLVEVNRVAWEVIHELDPEAYVAAPTSSGIADLAFLRSLLDLGLAKYMNAFAVHPYVQAPPEQNGFVDTVRSVKRILREYAGRDLPMIGTESGLNEDNTPFGEKTKLTGQLRQNLILLGEGFLWNLPFYGYDFAADAGDQTEGDYGLCYNNLLPKHHWGPAFVSPRPIAGALSAFARLTEGCRPTCTIEWLGETVLGYAFADRGDRRTVIALWDWGERGTTVELPVGREVISVADVMGNETRHHTAAGVLRLTLSEYPQYVLDPDVRIWGHAAQKTLNWSSRKCKSAADRAAVAARLLEPAFEGETPAVAVTLVNQTDADLEARLETRVYGEPETRHEKRVVVPARAERRVVVAFDGWAVSPTTMQDVEVAVTADKIRTSIRESLNFLAVPSRFAFDGGKSIAFDCDDAFLKVDAFVPDATPTNGWSGWGSWKGDSVQLGLAKRALKRRTGNDLADNAEEARSEITLALTPEGPQVYRTMTWDAHRFPTDARLGGLFAPETAPLSVAYENGGWRYRASVPWSFLNLSTPGPGQTFRFAFQFNDRQPGSRLLLQTKGFELKKRAPRQFGWAVLKDRE